MMLGSPFLSTVPDGPPSRKAGQLLFSGSADGWLVPAASPHASSRRTCSGTQRASTPLS